MDKIVSMSAFVSVVEKGSFSAASKELEISSTMVGNHIRFLESHLSTKLLNRTTRNQQLTEAGRIYYEHCKDITGRVSNAESDVRELHSSPRGLLKVTAPSSFGAQCLAAKINEYMETAPEVEIQLTLADYSIDLLDEGYDFAIRIGTLPSSGLIARPLKPYTMVLCASPSYLLKHSTPEVPSDLVDHQCLGFYYNGTLREWRFNHPDFPDFYQAPGKLSINSGYGLKKAALNGAGIIMQPECLVEQQIKDGNLVRLLEDIPLHSKPMNLVYLLNRQMPPKMRFFIDFILKNWGQ
ncbi:LysR family transcriptional regulator [Thalassomonas haliotis]|uniref:LysR family transcriptional regulator n=1 Tax=Thalassomonas haliotis TaxID=485448 RepID=A0ABY7VDT3_9GAMM|nr:LysR family transcriptional regulator [Thalassomonas haliotis]WDE11557.1 LysR family transcriptional regulator [Thalassomonas haliotis]